MKVLVACEYSATVRDAFIRKGHIAVSCDLLPTDVPGPHYQGDVRDILNDGWDLLIGHPYCTFNCLSGIRWMYHPEDTHLPAEQRRRHPAYPNRMDDFLAGAEFFNTLMNAPIEKVCLENSQPHGLAMSLIGRYTQVVQPWQHGDTYSKGAYLWLQGLDPLVPSNDVREEMLKLPEKERNRMHLMPPGPPRWKERSKTSKGIANAMAEQWGGNQ